MHRFFVPPEILLTSKVDFPPEIAHQVAAVLRLHAGQNVILLDDLGSEYEVCLTSVEKKLVSGQIAAKRPAPPEPPLRLSLYLCLTQREKFELILQKCTELGAAEFVPLISSRSLVQDAAEAARKQPRWQQILREAAEQCGRGRIPKILPVHSWEAALKTAASRHDRLLLAWEEEHSLTLKASLALLPRPTSLALLIGPEGGLSPAEAAQAQAAGFLSISLGPRILRLETAAIAATAAIFYELA